MKWITAFALALLGATGLAACTDAEALEAQRIEQQYGVSAYADTVTTADGPLKGTLVPITLANGRQGHLFIPQRQATDTQSVYIQDEQGLHPVQLKDNVSRAEVARSPGIVAPTAEPQRAEPQRANRRSWEKEVLIIGGSAAAGTAIGAIAGGKKGAAIGAAAGGVGGLIYDVITRDKN
jgi:hypothetical protein